MFENIAAVCSGVVKEQRRRLFIAEPRKCQHWSPESYRRSISISSYIYIDICYESWAQLRLFLMILKDLKCWFWSTNLLEYGLFILFLGHTRWSQCGVGVTTGPVRLFDKEWKTSNIADHRVSSGTQNLKSIDALGTRFPNALHSVPGIKASCCN